MKILIPDFSDSFMETVSCCWHLKASYVEDIASVKGTSVSEVEENGSAVFCRTVIEPTRPKGRDSGTVHVHIEIASERFFVAKKPVPSDNMDDISHRLHSILHGKALTSVFVTSGFRIPVDRIAVGSAIGSVLGFQDKLSSDHKALLSAGTLSIVSGGGDDDSLIDSLTFRLCAKGNKAYFLITTEGEGEKEYSPNCVVNAASQMNILFERMVLAKEPSQKREEVPHE